MDEKYIKILLKLANKAYRSDEAPVSAIIVHQNKVIAQAYNQREKSNLTIAHAEILAINKANKKLKTWRLNNCTMYATMRPCDMCEKVIKESRISKVYYLIDRDTQKRQYDKTEIIKLAKLENEAVIKKYQAKLACFWKNKR